MTLISHRNTFADQMGLAVRYVGENSQKMFCFANGGMLVTDLYASLDAAIARFGNRIVTGEKELKFSGPYQAGLADATARRVYYPNRVLGKQAVLEYGTGFIRGVLERSVVVEPVVIAKPAPEPVVITDKSIAMPEPVAVAPESTVTPEPAPESVKPKSRRSKYAPVPVPPPVVVEEVGLDEDSI